MDGVIRLFISRQAVTPLPPWRPRQTVASNYFNQHLLNNIIKLSESLRESLNEPMRVCS